MTNQTLAERETEVLIGITQDTTKDARTRTGAIKRLWSMHGDYFLSLMARKSRMMNSDWSLQGLSDKERGLHISDQVFTVFWKTVLKFDLTKGTPFLAHLTNMGKWDLKTAKRNNSKITEREVFIDFSLESRPNNPSKDPEDEEALMGALINEISAKNEFEKRIFHTLAIEATKRAISNKKRILEYFSVALEICNNSTKRYTDAEVAERMKITRAQVGNLRRQLLELLESSGLLTKYREVIAA